MKHCTSIAGAHWRLVVCALTVSLTLPGCASLPGDQLSNIIDEKVEISELPGPAPTVVFESGLGSYKETWDKVFPVIATTNSVFAYDRPGIGRTTATYRPRNGSTSVEDLRALLKSRNVRPPYVLVGHCAGGLYMQLFARHYPSEVAGLVLVDSTHPTQFEGDGALGNRSILDNAIIGTAGNFGPVKNEFDGLAKTGQEVLSAPTPPASLPIVILTAPDKSGTAIAAVDNAKRAHFARLYPGATVREIDSSHAIQRDNPQAVIEAIRDAVSMVRARSVTTPH
jgi:pimeloyl-ACP methyl ester carboxylesterase